MAGKDKIFCSVLPGAAVLPDADPLDTDTEAADDEGEDAGDDVAKESGPVALIDGGDTNRVDVYPEKTNQPLDRSGKRSGSYRAKRSVEGWAKAHVKAI